MIIGGLAILSAMYLVELAPRRSALGAEPGGHRMSDVMTIVVVAVVAAVLALIAFLIIRRQRYVRALRGRGWTFESSPRWSRS